MTFIDNYIAIIMFVSLLENLMHIFLLIKLSLPFNNTNNIFHNATPNRMV